jgi:hypothetical protein
MSPTVSPTDFWGLVAIAAPVILPMILVVAAYIYQALLQRLPMNQRLIVSSFAQTVVNAVEQMMPDAAGSEKKYTALQSLVKVLSSQGVKAPLPMVEMAIEAAVWELNQLAPKSALATATSALAASIAAGASTPAATPLVLDAKPVGTDRQSQELAQS